MYRFTAKYFRAGVVAATLVWLELAHGIPAKAQDAGTETPVAEQDENPTPAKPPAKTQRQIELELLAQSQPADTVQWLSAGGKPFLALYQRAQKKQALGSVLMLPSAGQHPDWPGTLSNLRHYLPTVGWSTLSIALPDPALSQPSPAGKTVQPEQISSAQNGISSDSADPQNTSNSEVNDIFNDTDNTVSDGVALPQQKKRVNHVEPGAAEHESVDRIIAAIEFLTKQDNKPIVLYGQGWGATRAGEYLLEIGPGYTIGAMIYVNGKNHLPIGDFDLVNALVNPDLPMLDLVDPLAEIDFADSEMRRKRMQSMGSTAYRQMSIPEMGSADIYLLKSIYGFLKNESNKK